MVAPKRALQKHAVAPRRDGMTQVVVVERHKLGVEHDYVVVSYTHCGLCKHPVALDRKMAGHMERGAGPLCVECATEIAEAGDLHR